MCVRSPKQWAKQTGASTEHMKPVIKTGVSHRWRCGKASNSKIRLLFKTAVEHLWVHFLCPVKLAGLVPLSYSLISWHDNFCFHAFPSICAQGFWSCMSIVSLSIFLCQTRGSDRKPARGCKHTFMSFTCAFLCTCLHFEVFLCWVETSTFPH